MQIIRLSSATSSRLRAGFCVLVLLSISVSIVTAQNLNITKLRPESGAPDSEVRIYGAGFSSTASDNSVYFGGVEAAIDSAESTVLYVRAPRGVSGPTEVSVNVGSSSVTASNLFTVITGGSGSFEKTDLGLTDFRRSAVDWGDYDSDGDLDLAISGDIGDGDLAAKIYRNDSGLFNDVGLELVVSGVVYGSLDWGDYNGDGKLDLVGTGYAPGLYTTTTIKKNDGDGSFSALKAGLTGVYNSSSEWADYNKDGSLDLVVTGYEFGGPPSTSIYRNDGSGSFSKIDSTLTDVQYSSVDWGDYDGDADLDLVFAGSDGNSANTTIYRNEGNGNFTPEKAGLTSVSKGAVEWGDYDSDGDLDLVVTGSAAGGPVGIIYRNEGNGTFSEARVGIEGVKESSADWGDYDGDGDLDLIVSGSDGSSPRTIIYRNEGNGSFSAVGAGLKGHKDGTANWVDYNGDGALDLLITGEDSGGNPSTVLYRNKTNPAPLNPRSVTAKAFTDSVELEWVTSQSSDIKRYRVYRDTQSIDSTAGPSSYTAFDSTAAGDTTFTDGTVRTDTTYYYRVTAIDTSGNESSFSAEVEATPGSSELNLSIKGIRHSEAILPVENSVPKDAVPYPPDTRTSSDTLETLRYPQDRVVLRARVRLFGETERKNVEVEAALDSTSMNVIIPDHFDSDGDGSIDVIPTTHDNQTYDYADVLLVSQNGHPSGAQGLSLQVMASPASRSAATAAYDHVTLHYAEHPEDNRTFNPQQDGYRFKNPGGLTFSEMVSLLNGYGIVGAAAVPLLNSATHNGRCFGMSGTAGIYFSNPSQNPFSNSIYEQSKDAEVLQYVSEYHVAQFLLDVESKRQNLSMSEKLDSIKADLTNKKPTMLNVVDTTNGFNHAVLGTKLTILEDKDVSIIEVQDSNLPGTTYDVWYAPPYGLIKNYTGVTGIGDYNVIAPLDVEDVPLFDSQDLESRYRAKIAKRVSETGKAFASIFEGSSSSKRKSAQAAATASSTSEEAYVLVESESGNKSGFRSDGSKVNEIPGAIVRKVPVDSSGTHYATYVAVPENGTYTTQITSSSSGDVRFERYRSESETTADVNYASGMSFSESTQGTYDEGTSTDDIQLDKDGDGTVDETVSTSSSTLPVEMAGLNASLTNAGVRLSWKTLSEENNSGFAVQRKTSSSGFERVGFVEGSGTRTEPKRYTFADEDLPYETDSLTYRLKQIDTDGSASYSEPITVQRGGPDRLQLLGTYPNPAQDHVTVRYALPEKKEAEIGLYNILGQQVRTIISERQEGRKKTRIDVSGLASGTYFLRLTVEDKTRTRKLTLVK